MKWLDKLLIWTRIKRLEDGYAGKKRDLENLVTRWSDKPPEEDFGITREIRELKKIIEGKGGET